MVRPRLWASAVVAAAALTIAGCYGSTEPATKITFDGATLNAQGTANHGQAQSWFEFWATDGGTHYQVGNQTWPAGVSGPISYTYPGRLAPNTNYSFRLCGNDSGGDAVCAQTRTFTTADGDQASGLFTVNNGANGVSFSAWSGPHGERVNGSMHTSSGSLVKAWDVNCLKVSGNRAIVGGTIGDDGGPVFMIQDSNPDVFSVPKSDAPSDCSDITFDDFTPQAADSGSDGTVHDAP